MFNINNKVFIVNFKHISHLCSSVSIVNFEHVIAGWEENDSNNYCNNNKNNEKQQSQGLQQLKWQRGKYLCQII